MHALVRSPSESRRSTLPGPSPEVAAWLVSSDGLRTLAETTERLDGSDALAVGTALRERGLTPERAAAATSVAATRLRARERYDDADRLVFTPALLEQASHPVVAAWRARRFGGAGTVVDLCCGAGSDAMVLSEHAAVVAVDHDAVACLLARHNVAARRGNARTVLGDATRPPVPPGTPIHIDPARRVGSRRARALTEYRPSVPAVLPVLRAADGAGLVVSPAVDVDDPHLPDDGELEFVQVGNDLLEAVVWLGDLRTAGVASSASLLGSDGDLRARLVREGPPGELPVQPFGRWLVEVAPAVVRARLHDRVGASLDAWRVAERRALLSTDRRPDGSPLYRSWEVEAVLPVRARDLRSWLRDAEDLPLEIATHGLDIDPQDLWTRLGSPPRGPSGRRLHLVRLDTGAAAVATRAG